MNTPVSDVQTQARIQSETGLKMNPTLRRLFLLVAFISTTSAFPFETVMTPYQQRVRDYLISRPFSTHN